jgi:type IV pilus assembly protein PilW
MSTTLSRLPSRTQGFSLVELMIAMVLGLLVVGAAGGLFLANRKVYGSTETINRIQENGRAAFEIMSRDLREAGGNPCLSPDVTPVNMLKSKDSTWWQNFNNGLTGTDGSGAAPDSVLVHLANGGDYRVVRHDTPSATLELDHSEGLVDGGIYMACNPEVGVIFKATSIMSGNKVQHNGGGGSDPSGNFCPELQWKDPEACTGASGSNGYCFMVPAGSAPNPNCSDSSNAPAVLVGIYSAEWSIEDNTRGGTSLYRTVIVNRAAGDPTDEGDKTKAEIAEGVTDMQITYKIGDAPGYVDAAAVTAASQWKAVTAAKVVLTLQGVEGALTRGDIRGTDDQVLTRTLVNVVAIRNRRGIL